MSEELSEEEREILQKAELRRKQKAATIKVVPDIPGRITVGDFGDVLQRTEEAARRNRDKADRDSQARKEMEEHQLIAECREGWGAPVRHLLKRREVKNLYAPGPWRDCLEKISVHLVKSGALITLLGTRGGGKTQLAVELMFHVTAKRRRARYVTAMEIFLEVKAAYRKDSKETEEMVVDSFCKPQLLVIDEVHERGETGWEDRILTHIIDKRYRSMLDTILIANLERNEFVASMGKSVVSRLNETGGIITCNWPSFR